eukprot:1229354-Pleurochrysis_carterae.AAC.2
MKARIQLRGRVGGGSIRWNELIPTNRARQADMRRNQRRQGEKRTTMMEARRGGVCPKPSDRNTETGDAD